MSRLKLKAKSNIKRIKLKRANDISSLFDLSKPLYYSDFALTDDYNTVLFFINDQFIQNNELTDHVEKINLNENDLQIKFNNQLFLKPKKLIDHYLFENMGMIEKEKINWFFSNYPNCVFHPVTNWFGKSVNTLIIVLVESFGKVVGVVKTNN
jgi:hypothetical protein